MLHLYLVLLRRRPRLLRDYQSDSSECELRGCLVLDNINWKGKGARIVADMSSRVHNGHVVIRLTRDLWPLCDCLDEKRICKAG